MESIPYDDEANLLSSDSKFRSYASNMDKALKAFEGSGEWADLINSLTKIQKVLQGYAGKYTVVPRKTLVAKRLAQVLHPALPSGVHLKALEIYHIIFSVIGHKGLSEDLFLYSAGLFPLLGTSSMSIKPKLLEIYETFYVPLGSALEPAMPALLHGILPGLEEGSEYYSPTLRLLEIFKKHVPNFQFALWKCAFDNSTTRFQALTFVFETQLKSLPSQKQSGNPGQANSMATVTMDIMVHALCECLQDNSVLVQRMALDIVIGLIGFDDSSKSNTSEKNMVLLTSSALNVLLRKDLSLNRRLFSWITGADEKIANERIFLDALISFVVISQKICVRSPKSINRAIMLRPLRVISMLLDSKSDMNWILSADHGTVMTTLFRFLITTTHAILGISFEELNETSSTNHRAHKYLDHRTTGDLIKSANLLFQEMQKHQCDLIWNFFGEQLELCCSRRNSATEITPRANSAAATTAIGLSAQQPMSVVELCHFVSFFLDIISLFSQETYEDAFERQIPNFLNRMTSLMSSYCEQLLLKTEISECLKLAVKLIERVHPSACYVSYKSSTANPPTNTSLVDPDGGMSLPEVMETMNPLSSASSEDDLNSQQEGGLSPLPQSRRSEKSRKNNISSQSEALNITSLPDTEDMSDDEELPQTDLTDESLESSDDERSKPELDHSINGGKDCVTELSVVQACITSFKQFLHQFLLCKIFKPAFRDDLSLCESMIERYAVYLTKEYPSVDAFNVELKARLTDCGGAKGWRMLVESNPDDGSPVRDNVALVKIEVGKDWEDLLEAFDLSCKLLHSFCTLPVHKQNDALLSESGDNGGKLKLPDWLMSMFICSCFIADSFPLQAKAIDCMLQQFVLSSTQSAELAFSEDQSIIPSITRRQLAVIKHSYNLFLEMCLSLWNWLDTSHSGCHETAVDLWLQLHNCCPLSDLCENVMVHCMQKPSTGGTSHAPVSAPPGFLVPTGAGAVTTTVAAGWCVGGLEACRRFSTIWHLSRAFTQANTLSTAGQPSFDKSLFVMLDGLVSGEVTRRTVAKQWLVHCILRGDIGRLLEPLVLILLHQKTSRVLAEGFVATGALLPPSTNNSGGNSIASSSLTLSQSGGVNHANLRSAATSGSSRNNLVALQQQTPSFSDSCSSHPPRTVSESEDVPSTVAPSPNHNNSSVFVTTTATTTGGVGVGVGGNKYNYLSEMEQEMMIDSEEFEEVDPRVVIKHLLAGIIENAMTMAEEKENREPFVGQLEQLTVASPKEMTHLSKSLSCDIKDKLDKETRDDHDDHNLLLPGVTFESKRMGNGLQSKTMSASLNTVVGGTDADFGRPYPSEDLQIADELNLNFDPKPDFKPELNIDALNKLISTGMQNLTTAIIASNPESKNNLASLDQIFANFFLLYKQCFDFHRCLHAFKTLTDILKANPVVFLNSISSTNIGSGNTPYVHQVPSFIARHKNSILGKDFYAEVPPQQLVPFRNAMYIELLITISLYYLRSTFPFDLVKSNSSRVDFEADTEARIQNCQIQIQATEFLVEVFKGINELLQTSTSRQNLCMFVNDLLSRCKVQKTIFLSLLCHVKTNAFANKFQSVALQNSNFAQSYPAEFSDSKSLEVKLLELIVVLVKTEFFVFVSYKRKQAEEQDFLFVESPRPVKEQGSSSLLRYNTEELIVCQAFFVQTVIEALKQYDLLALHSYWLNFVISILPYASKGLKDIVVPTVNQICRNLEILSDPMQIETNGVKFLPPDFIIILLDSLSNFFSFCTLDSMETQVGSFAISNPSAANSVFKSKTGPEDATSRTWANVPTNQQSIPPSEQTSTIKKEFWQDAKKGLLDILPRVLSSLLTVWKSVDPKNSATKSSTYITSFVTGQPSTVRQHIIDCIHPLALLHGSKLFAAIALVWNGRREKNRIRKLNENATTDQLVLVTLIKSVPTLNMEAVVPGVAQVLKFSNPSMQVKKQPIMEISILQFLFAYIKSYSSDDIDTNSKVILPMIKESIQNTSHGGQIILLLITNYVIDKMATEQRDLRELQDLVSRLAESVSSLATLGLVQSAWIGKLYTVKPGPQMPSTQYDLLLHGGTENERLKNLVNVQPTSTNSVQSLENLASILPNLLDVIYRSEEKDKINSVLQGVVSVVLPYLKTRTVDNVPSLRASSSLIAEMSYFHYTRKSWRKEIFELFLEKSFFQMTPETMPHWKVVIDNLMTHDKISFKEFLGQNSVYGFATGLIKSRDVELDLKAKLLKRLAFVVFASEKDQYNRILPELQERVSDVLKSGPSPVVTEQIFMLFRIFLMRLNPDSLTGLWPIMISELTTQLKQLEFDLLVEAGKVTKLNGTSSLNHQMNSSWLAMYLSVCKFLDTALLYSKMSLSHFQTYVWAFIGSQQSASGDTMSSSVEEGKRKFSGSSSGNRFTCFVPYCVKICQLLEERTSKKQNTRKLMPMYFGYPLLHFDFYSLETIGELQPFFSTICHSQIHYPASISPLADTCPEAVYAADIDFDNYKGPKSMNKRMTDLFNLPLTKAADAEDFLEKLVERDFSEFPSE